MKNFLRLQDECLKELEDTRIPVGRVEKWEINRRATTRWGQCVKKSTGGYIIQISARLLEDDRISEKDCKTTMLHELLHTCRGGMKHTGKWKEYADILNAKYGYDIKRVTSGEEKGVENHKVKHRAVKYIFKCRFCGQTISRTRACKFTRYYKNYICGLCGNPHAFIRIN